MTRKRRNTLYYRGDYLQLKHILLTHPINAANYIQRAGNWTFFMLMEHLTVTSYTADLELVRVVAKHCVGPIFQGPRWRASTFLNFDQKFGTDTFGQLIKTILSDGTHPVDCSRQVINSLIVEVTPSSTLYYGAIKLDSIFSDLKNVTRPNYAVLYRLGTDLIEQKQCEFLDKVLVILLGPTWWLPENITTFVYRYGVGFEQRIEQVLEALLERARPYLLLRWVVNRALDPGGALDKLLYAPPSGKRFLNTLQSVNKLNADKSM